MRQLRAPLNLAIAFKALNFDPALHFGPIARLGKTSAFASWHVRLICDLAGNVHMDLILSGRPCLKVCTRFVTFDYTSAGLQLQGVNLSGFVLTAYSS